MSHAAHKNRHCHTQRTKTGIVTRSAQKQALSHAAHKNRHCHMQRTKTGIVTRSAQKQVLSHASTLCTKAGIVTRSHIVHKSRYCHTQPHRARKQVLSHAAHKSRHCHTTCTKTGIQDVGQPSEWCRRCVLGSKSFRSESRFTQAHSPLHLGGGLRVQPFKIMRLQVQIQIHLLPLTLAVN